jgi:hypothetical protein
MRSSWVVSANLSAVSANPGAVMVITHGAASIPITVTIARASVSSPETYETNTGGIFALLAFIFGKDRHKRLREGAFGKNTPQQIRQFKGDEKGVGRHPGAKNTRHNRIAGKAQHARKHGHRTDGRQ